MAIRPCGCCDLIGIQSIVCPRGVEVVFTISIPAPDVLRSIHRVPAGSVHNRCVAV